MTRFSKAGEVTTEPGGKGMKSIFLLSNVIKSLQYPAGLILVVITKFWGHSLRENLVICEQLTD